MLDWNDLRLAHALFETRSLVGAAKKLRMHQTTAGRRLDALEAALRVPLFVRTSRGLVPTGAGERVSKLVAPLAEGLFRLEREPLEPTDEARGVVRVAATEVTALHLLEHVLPKLSRVAPKLVLEVVTGNLAADVLRGEVEVAVRLVRPESRELLTKRIGELAYGLYASRGYLASRTKLAATPPYAGHKVIEPARELERGPAATYLNEHAREAEVAFRANSMVAMARAGELGLGLVVLPRALAATFPALAEAARLGRIAPRPIYLVARKEDLRIVRVRTAFDTIARELGAYVGRYGSLA